MRWRGRAAIGCAALLRRYPYKGKTLLWNQLESLLDPADVEVRHAGGGRMLIDTRLFWQRQMMAACFERAGAWAVPRLLRPGEVFIDGGANCGYYSCLAAGAVGPAGRVIAFEPDARLHRQLATQRELNGGIIQVETAALSDDPGDTVFHVNPAADPQGLTVGHGSLEPHDGWLETRVAATTLDGYLERHAIGGVRLAKFDLEGHEYQGLTGAAGSLAAGVIENVLVEVNDRRTAGLLQSFTWTHVLRVGRGWAPVDLGTLGGTQIDVLCLRGEGARRWAALRAIARFV